MLFSLRKSLLDVSRVHVDNNDNNIMYEHCARCQMTIKLWLRVFVVLLQHYCERTSKHGYK